MNQLLGKSPSPGRTALLMGLGMMLVWGVFSVYYATERLYGDSAFYLFKLVNEKHFSVEHARPAGVVMQVLPLILVKLHAPLKLVILAFSLNEWLWYLAGFLFIAWGLKSPSMALAMVFTLVFGDRWNFFNPVSELLLGTPFLFMLLAILQKEEWKRRHRIATALLIPVICFNHPLFGFILPACLVLSGILATPARRKRIAACLLYALAIMAVRYYSLDEYEKEMVTDTKLSYADRLKLLDEFYFKKFLAVMIPLFTGTVCLTLLLLSFLRKRPFFMIVLSGLLAGYFFLLIWQFGDYYTNKYEMFERYFYPLTLLVCFSFFSIFSYNKKALLVGLLALGFFHFGLIHAYGNNVSRRYDQFERALKYVEQFNSDKLVFRGDNYNTIKYGEDWYMANESLLLSARQGPRSTKQIFILEAPGYETIQKLWLDEYFYAPWWGATMKHLNRTYFDMDSTAFRYVNTDSVQTFAPDDYLKNVTATLNGPEEAKSNHTVLMPLSVTNANKEPLFSGTRKINVGWSYRWTQRDGSAVACEEKVTLLLADLYSYMDQEIVVQTPTTEGHYTLQLMLVMGENRYAVPRATCAVRIR